MNDKQWWEDAEKIAQNFHYNYEALAPEYDYRTRKASAKPWLEVPENNRRLMVHVVSLILPGIISEAQRREREEIVKMVEGMIEIGPGGHGQCCVCQTCKFFNEDCVCTKNTVLQDVINAIKEKK